MDSADSSQLRAVLDLQGMLFGHHQSHLDTVSKTLDSFAGEPGACRSFLPQCSQLFELQSATVGRRVCGPFSSCSLWSVGPLPGNFPVNLLFVPLPVYLRVLHWGHSSRLACHMGMQRSKALISQRFWCASMDENICRYKPPTGLLPLVCYALCKFPEEPGHISHGTLSLAYNNSHYC